MTINKKWLDHSFEKTKKNLISEQYSVKEVKELLDNLHVIISQGTNQKLNIEELDFFKENMMK